MRPLRFPFSPSSVAPRNNPGQAWDGWPSLQQESGWHWVEDDEGLRPLLWRGDDWPDALDRHGWQDGYALLAPSDLCSARYWGPAQLPPGASEQLRRTLQLSPA